MTDFRIIPREEWGAKYKNGFGSRPVGNLERWAHHSVTQAPDLVAPYDDDYAAVRTLELIGQNRFGGGISYNFPITPAGLIFEGVGIDRIGAHTAGHNTKGVGIVFVGNYQTNDLSQQQIDASVWLLRHGVEQGWWKEASFTGGHRDTKSTACPGDKAYAMLGQINALAGGAVIVPAPTPTPTPPPAPTNPHGRPLLNEDGALGPKTITEFQYQTGTPADGVISRPYSSLVAQVQRNLNARGLNGYNGKSLTVDGKGIYENTQGSTPKTNTQYALQGYLGTPRDGVLTGPPSYSNAVRELQRRLNAGNFWQ